ncbi:MAG: hypothetical protein ING26_13275, partial [Roseomonas sp.]|nr:hypothetical protein [Roseomonas sp.]
PIRRALAWLGVAVAAAWGFYFAGRKAANSDRDTEELQNEVEAHARLNKAPSVDGLSDDDIRSELHDYAKRNSR